MEYGLTILMINHTDLALIRITELIIKCHVTS